jgi:uncharacterized protein (UPF0335 family)
MSARRDLADQIDPIDAEIAQLQDDKKAIFGAYRDAQGKAECRAAQVAIRKRQKANAGKREEIEEHDALVDEIFEEITSPAPRATRVAMVVPDAA